MKLKGPNLKKDNEAIDEIRIKHRKIKCLINSSIEIRKSSSQISDEKIRILEQLY